jgi:hypothetical protein
MDGQGVETNRSGSAAAQGYRGHETRTTVERAFELAASGRCRSIEAIRQQLTREDYSAVHAHLAGPLIKRQLRERFPRRRPITGSPAGRERPHAR